MTLVVVVMAVLLSVFSSLNTGATRQTQSIEAHAALRQALSEVGRDLRSATSLRLVGMAGAAPEDLRVELLDGVTVRYRVTGAQLVRETLRSGRVQSSRSVLSGIPPHSRTPTFRYYSPTGRELLPGVLTLGDLNRCTARVVVRLGNEPAPGRGQSELSASVALRGVIPEEVPC